MDDCCRPVGPIRCYWPGGRCPVDAPLADSVPWTVDEADLIPGSGAHGSASSRYHTATKTVGVVTIVGTVLNPASNTGFVFPGNTAATSGSPATSLGVAEGNGTDPNMTFAVSVPQPMVQMKVEDIDSPQGSGLELVRTQLFGKTNPARRADNEQFVRPVVGPPPNPAAVLSYSNDGDYRVDFADENALLLTWRNNPWGDGGNGADPVQVQYMNQTGANRGSYFDFSGPIYQEECTLTPRHARAILCCDCDPNEVASIVNGSFEVPSIGGNGFQFVPEGNVPGWDSEGTASIEIWGNNFNPNGNPGLVPYPSPQIAEILGPPGTTAMEQIITTPSEEMVMTWGYMHGKRDGGGNTETAILQLGDATQPPAGHEVVDTHALGAGAQDWVQRWGTWVKPAGVTSVRMRFTGTNTLVGQAGNLIDQVTLTGQSCFRWIDTETGDELGPADIATITACGPSEQP